MAKIAFVTKYNTVNQYCEAIVSAATTERAQALTNLLVLHLSLIHI